VYNLAVTDLWFWCRALIKVSVLLARLFIAQTMQQLAGKQAGVSTSGAGVAACALPLLAALAHPPPSLMNYSPRHGTIAGAKFVADVCML